MDSGAKNRRALLFINHKKSEAAMLAETIRAALSRRGWGVDAFSFENKTGPFGNERGPGRTGPDETTDQAGPDEAAGRAVPAGYDISLSLGGDGTVLYASRFMAPLEVPVLPVNLGTLGFIAAVSPAEWEGVFDKWEAGEAAISRRLMLEVRVEREGKTVFRGRCLNDAVISAAGIAKLIRLEVQAETSGPPGPGTERSGFAAERIDLGRFRADGLIVATPTGSTGYSVAAGGPIIDPEMDAVIINPICPFTLSNRPIVVPPDERIITLVEPEQRSPVLLTVDGQITEGLESGDRVIVRRFPQALRLVASDRWAFYRALRSKLAWSGGTAQAAYGGGSESHFDEQGENHA
ncbi:MAG: NAD(+)/NADH kinase [Treponema sp.]|jgi:NAD+ kinase|nr:NAD(+)/NADH kinase [Treponema sp.]